MPLKGPESPRFVNHIEGDVKGDIFRRFLPVGLHGSGAIIWHH